MNEDSLKKCSVHIGGVSYQLVTQENEIYSRQIAAKADEMIRHVLQSNPQLSQSMATVLALVNAVDELSRAYQHIQTIEQKDLDLKSQTSETRQELNRLREQNWEMKKELLRLNDLNRDYERLINQLTEPAAASADEEDEPAPADDADTPVSQDLKTEPETQRKPEEDAPSAAERLSFQQTDLDEYLKAAGLITDDDKPTDQ